MSESSAVLPHHIAIILDGNRRWATNRGMPGIEGHRVGFTTLQTIADYALERGIKYFSAYAFSTENWARSNEEVAFLMMFLRKRLKKEIGILHKKGVRFLWLGREEKLDTKLVQQLRDAEELTADNKAGTFSLCFNYGGQAEIADAATKAAQKGPVTVQTIAENLYGGAELPPVDLLIRTSGEQRISNFMLWRAAYSELFFTDVLWPDFSTEDLDEALAHYASRQRRFGS
jgi:undecaprenyl diphosphate synthase